MKLQGDVRARSKSCSPLFVYQEGCFTNETTSMTLLPNKVNKIVEGRFIYEVKDPTWITNIISIIKKNGQLCVCVDF